jgi:CheY-like chemotaxis protein
MGGDIMVESTPGLGSTFRFDITAKAASTSKRRAPKADKALRGMRCLVVDDNATNRRILTLQLKQWGVDAEAVESGSRALRMLESGHKFELAILDMMMPEMDGLELADHISQRWSDLPVIILSSVGTATAGLPPFVRAYVNKPVRPFDLHKVVTRVLSGSDATGCETAITSDPTDSTNALRILVAEDNSHNQMVARFILEKLGYRADFVADGAEAVAAVRQRPYDVVLMDLRMPEMDGIEATSLILAEVPESSRPRIIAMTADVTKDKREACFAAGMVGFIPKPIDREELGRLLGMTLPEQQDGLLAIETSSEMPQGLDFLTLRKMVGDNEEALRSFIDEYANNAAELIANMHASLKAGDLVSLGRAAHTLKSSSALMDFHDLSSLCAALEADCDQENRSQLTDRIDQLTNAWTAAQRKINAFASNGAANPMSGRTEDRLPSRRGGSNPLSPLGQSAPFEL